MRFPFTVASVVVLLVLVSSFTFGGCAIAAVVAAVSYASSSADEADAKMIASRAQWESMNVERHKAGLPELPYPGDDQIEKLSPEDRLRGRLAWEKMNETRLAEGKEALPMPEIYKALDGDPTEKPAAPAPNPTGGK